MRRYIVRTWKNSLAYAEIQEAYQCYFVAHPGFNAHFSRPISAEERIAEIKQNLTRLKDTLKSAPPAATDAYADADRQEIGRWHTELGRMAVVLSNQCYFDAVIELL